MHKSVIVIIAIVVAALNVLALAGVYARRCRGAETGSCASGSLRKAGGHHRRQRTYASRVQEVAPGADALRRVATEQGPSPRRRPPAPRSLSPAPRNPSDRLLARAEARAVTTKRRLRPSTAARTGGHRLLLALLLSARSRRR